MVSYIFILVSCELYACSCQHMNAIVSRVL